MNWAQWVFEFKALQKKEEDEFNVQAEILKTSARIFRDTLVSVLGLNQLVPESPKSDDAAAAAKRDDAGLPFVPAAFVMGNHHLLAHYIEEQKKAADAERAMSDTAFDEFSKRLASGDVGDMNPLLLGERPDGRHISDVHAEEAVKELLAAMGVKQRPASAPAVAHFGLKPKDSSGGGGVQISLEDEERLVQDIPGVPPRSRAAVGPAPVPRDNVRVGLDRIELEPGVFVGGE